MKADDIRRGGLKPESLPEPLIETEGIPGIGRMGTGPRDIPVICHEKVPWPGNMALWNWAMYDKGLTADRSGWDQINRWLVTATPEEFADCQIRAEAMGKLVGMGLGWVAAKFLINFSDHIR